MTLKVVQCMHWKLFRTDSPRSKLGREEAVASEYPTPIDGCSCDSASAGVVAAAPLHWVGDSSAAVVAEELSPRGLVGALVEALGRLDDLALDEAIPDGSATDAAFASAAATEITDAAEVVQQRLLAVLRNLDKASSAANAPAAQHVNFDFKLALQLEEGRSLVAALLAEDAPALLVARLEDLGFETRKDAMRLFSSLLKTAFPLGTEAALVDYIRSHPRITQLLLYGSGRQGVFTHCAQMLRECTRHPELVAALMNQGASSRLIELACHRCFDVSSEAFSSLRQLLLGQKDVSAKFIASNFTTFFAEYHTLLHPDRDYVARRQALRLLGDTLLDRAYMEVMIAYVEEEQFLQIHMNLLRDSSKTIQVDAFHVFKIFVANPNKPYRVLAILHKNRDRLLRLLGGLAGPRRPEGSGGNAGGAMLFDEDLMAITEVLKALELPRRIRTRSRSDSPPHAAGAAAAAAVAGCVGELEEAAPSFVEAA